MRRSLLFFALVLFATNVFAVEKTILVIESYHSGYAWDASYLEGLRETFDGRYNLVSFEMDTKRQPKSLYQKQADLAWQKYLELKPDLVIIGDDNALKLLGPKFNETNTPVVFLGINTNPRDYIEMDKNITGVLERPIFKLSIGSITEIVKPKPDKILVLFDSGTTSQASVADAFDKKASAVISGTKVDLRLISHYDLWQQTVLQAAENGYDAIVVGLYHTIVGNDGKNISADQIMAWTSANTPVPPFGFWDFSVGKGQTIGGFVLYGKEQGIAAAKMAEQILQGTPLKDIRPIVGNKGQFVFSKSELEKYKLSLPVKISEKAKMVQ